MTPNQEEELQNIRRIAESGLRIALHQPADNNYVDIFQHILDIYKRISSDEVTLLNEHNNDASY